MNEPAKPKSIFKSKTAWAGALSAVAGALGTFAPDLAPLMAKNADVILLVAGVLQVVLRLVTKGRISLFSE